MTRNLFAAVMLTVGCVAPEGPGETPPTAGLPKDADQALVVWPAEGSATRVKVVGWERTNGRWDIARRRVDGVIGRNGFADADAKREGDGKTPSGVYPLGPAFGYAASAATKLDYRQATANDFWVDDPESPDYNRWVVGRPKAKSFELMRRDDDLYKLGAVIGYNTDPVVPGRGSAIFLHVWRGPDSTTAGCVALAEEDVAAFLKWLDKAKHPVAVLNPR